MKCTEHHLFALNILYVNKGENRKFFRKESLSCREIPASHSIPIRLNLLFAVSSPALMAIIGRGVIHAEDFYETTWPQPARQEVTASSAWTDL